jgi:hypothetical protein
MNLATWVQRNGRLRPDSPALAVGATVFATWAQWAATTRAIAGGLAVEYALGQGDRVAIVMRNRPEYLEALFAIWHAGLVAVPVNARLHRDEIAYILATAARAGPHRPRARRRRRPARRPRSMTCRRRSSPRGRTGTTAASLLTPDAAGRSVLGRPGVALLHQRHDRPPQGRDAHPRQPAHGVAQLLRRHRPDRAAYDSVLHAAPLSHGSGLYGLPHVAKGAVSVFPHPGARRRRDAALIARWPGCRSLPRRSMVKRLAATRRWPLRGRPGGAQDDHLRRGADVSRGPRARPGDLRPELAQIYGQGETPMTITALSLADHADREHPRLAARMQGVSAPPHRCRGAGRRSRTCGGAARGTGRDRRARPGRHGGYWRQPEATAETLRDGLAAHRRHRELRRATVPHPARPVQGPHHQRRDEHLSARGRGGADDPPGVRDVAVVGGRTPSGARRSWRSSCRGPRRRPDRRPRRTCLAGSRVTSARRSTASSTRCRPTTTARCSSANCARSGCARTIACRTLSQGSCADLGVVPPLT